MKRNLFIYIALIGFFCSCSEEFLERPPQDAITIGNYFKTVEQINAATGFLYSMPWFTLNDRAHWAFGDVRAGNIWIAGDLGAFFTFTETPTHANLAEGWLSLWMVVAHSNAIINEVPHRAPAGIPREVVDRAVAEALFMRATAYFYLVRLWGGVPIIEDPSGLVDNPKIPRNRVEDVYRLIIRDLEKAIESLPAEPFQPGRVTQWSAKGMLAKVNLAYSGYGQTGSRRQEYLDRARELAGEVINQSGLSLKRNFADLFKYEYENNEESLFAFQWVSCLGWGTQNTNQAMFAAGGRLTGVGDGWGENTGPTIDLQREFEPYDLRRQPTFMIDGDHYPELLRAAGGYTHEMNEQAPLAAMANIKKYVIGTPADNDGNVCFMSTGINTYVLRLADVYLIYAEAVLGNNASTTDPSALAAFNAVRERAGLPERSSITWEDIRRERRVELAIESDYWYDLVRWWYYDPQGAINHINNQERGQFAWNAETEELMVESRRFTITDQTMYLPIPAGDAARNPLLLQDPVPYDFGD